MQQTVNVQYMHICTCTYSAYNNEFSKEYYWNPSLRYGIAFVDILDCVYIWLLKLRNN